MVFCCDVLGLVCARVLAVHLSLSLSLSLSQHNKTNSPPGTPCPRSPPRGYCYPAGATPNAPRGPAGSARQGRPAAPGTVAAAARTAAERTGTASSSCCGFGFWRGLRQSVPSRYCCCCGRRREEARQKQRRRQTIARTCWHLPPLPHCRTRLASHPPPPPPPPPPTTAAAAAAAAALSGQDLTGASRPHQLWRHDCRCYRRCHLPPPPPAIPTAAAGGWPRG